MGSHSTTQYKGQIFGSGLQLCASGAPAEPERTTPYRDQRHPHTVKCQAQRRARESKPKTRRRRQNIFYSGGELGSGTVERAGLDTVTLITTTQIPHRSPGEKKQKKNQTHPTMPGLHFHPEDLAGFEIMLLRFLLGQICSWASLCIVECRAHYVQAVLHMNNVIFGISMNALLTKQCGNYQLSKNPDTLLRLLKHQLLFRCTCEPFPCF